MINVKADEVVEELFESLCNRYENNLEKLMKDSDFVFDYVHLLYFKCCKINPNCGRLFVNSPDWKKQKSNNR